MISEKVKKQVHKKILDEKSTEISWSTLGHSETIKIVVFGAHDNFNCSTMM